MAHTQPYQYAPLFDHDIRLLKVTDQADPRICGTIIHKSLDDLASSTPSTYYYAISYCWGDSTTTDTLWLSATEYLPISASAANVLTHVTCDDYIWIDSVCIDQNNLEEKSWQLRIMWGIYKFAKCVLAWPGGCEDGGGIAMELLFDIYYAPLTKRLTGRDPVSLAWWATTSLEVGRPALPADFHLHRERWAALARFLDRPWFRRAWIIQEVVAARETIIVMGGWQTVLRSAKLQWNYLNSRSAGFVFRWDEMVSVINDIRSQGCISVLEITDESQPCAQPVMPSALESIDRIAALKPAREDDRPNFQNNLLRTTAAEASDPRDKVFAVGSMSYGSLEEQLIPNYKLSVQEVYVNATQRLMLRDQYLLTLHMAGIGWKNRMSGLPSWVPDYSITRRSGTRHGEDFVLGKIAPRALFASANLRLTQQQAKILNLASWKQLIRLYGIIVDDIEVVCRGLPPKRGIWISLQSDNWIDRRVIRSWFDMVHSQICPDGRSKSYVTANLFKKTSHRVNAAWDFGELQALASALIAGSSYDGGPLAPIRFSSFFDEYWTMYSAFIRLLRDSAFRPIQPVQEIPGLWQRDRASTIKQDAEAYARSLDRLPNWTVFRTRSGYIGRGPPLLRKGDKVCVFEGGRTPFILRKAKIPWYCPSTFYHLVGECYVEGLMSKEAWEFSWWRWGYIVLW